MINRSTRRQTVNSDKKNSFSSGLVSYVLSVVLLALSGILVMNSVKSISKAQQRNMVVELARAQVDEMRLRNLELMAQKEEVCQESYVEREARNRLLFAKEGEILVVLPESGGAKNSEDGNGVDADSDTEIDGSANDSDGWSTWWSLVRDGI